MFEHSILIRRQTNEENGIFNEHSRTKQIDHRRKHWRRFLVFPILFALSTEVLREDRHGLFLEGVRRSLTSREKIRQACLISRKTRDGTDMKRFAEKQSTFNMPEDLVGFPRRSIVREGRNDRELTCRTTSGSVCVAWRIAEDKVVGSLPRTSSELEYISDTVWVH